MVILLGLFSSFAFSGFFLRSLKKIAIKIDFVDRPNGALKKHGQATPYLGGVGIFLGAWISIIGVSYLSNCLSQDLLALFFLNLILLVLGTWDDRRHISWRIRLFIQLLVSAATIYFLDLYHSAGVTSFIFYTIFLAGIINSINLIDISDGLSSTISISSITILILADLFLLGDLNIALLVVEVGFLGSLSYFLFINFPPAKMYMGDGGSNCLGHILGVLCFASFTNLDWVTGTLSTALVLAIPLFDTFFVMALRLSKRKNPFLGSPDHFAVRMRLNGYSALSILFSTLFFTAVIGLLVIITLIKSSAVFSAILSAIIFSSFLLVAFILFKAFPIESDRTLFFRDFDYES